MNETAQVLSAIFTSMLLPGLGQAMQKRIRAALAFFALFAVAIFFFSLIGNYALIFYVPLVFYASLDVALQDHPKVQKNVLHYIFGTILFFLMLTLPLLPAVVASREAARRMVCVSNYKMLALALHSYHYTYNSLPPAYTVDAEGKPLHSWRVLVLPYIEEKELYDKIRLDEPWDSEHNRQFHNVSLQIFRCYKEPGANPLFQKVPDLRRDGDCYISVVLGEKTAFPGSKAVSLGSVHDSNGDTILLVERLMPVCWMDPNQEIPYETAILGFNKDINGIGSFHEAPVCFSVAFCDGSVTSLPHDIPAELFEAMLTISGDEKIGDWREELKRTTSYRGY